MTVVLGLDTSSDLGTVALVVDGVALAEIEGQVRARHGEALLPLVARALERLGAGVDRAERSEAGSQIDLIAVGVGPGSFTGTRVGVATAKGLSLGLGCPLVGVGSLRAIAHATALARVAPLVDAHKGEVFAALYERVGGAELTEVVAPFHAPPAEALARLRAVAGSPPCLVGSGLRRYPELAAGWPDAVTLDPEWDLPRALSIAEEGRSRWLAHGPDDASRLEPRYLRPSDAILPTRPLRDPRDSASEA